MRRRASTAVVFVLVAAACGKKAVQQQATPDAAAAPATIAPVIEAGAEDAEPPSDAAADAADAGPTHCPPDMAYVDTTFCPEIERRCLDSEHDSVNNLDICHAFAKGEQHCRTPKREKRLTVCIDRYEYPNEKGAHPVWMLDWYQAQATCESKGKRLCLDDEWTAACEGPEHTPFAYGWERDHFKCNMDNFYIDPAKPAPDAQFYFYSPDKEVQHRELVRLDQSVPSGSMETCKSGFGVYDMSGNVDEWAVNSSYPREKSQFAGLKGGAWGHVRSQCRPETYSHDPGFTYYFVGFRCCRDADDVPAATKWKQDLSAVPAPKVPPHDFAPEPIVATGAPGPNKSKWSRGHGLRE
ncbi:MAG TPA: SUMF1/EgtB/PvdO family nonheme iron enzyme [Polyangiaceae bacterium]